ncbi:MAG: DUF4838 domain-containing protein [Paenibacillaceae bacterium]|nr:DUF4838 domain-containing protein [Paenibacillaceae bacterium]
MEQERVLHCLADHGRSDWRIVVSRGASPSEVYAAEELQKFLGEMSGATMPIFNDGEAEAAREIRIGFGTRLPHGAEWPAEAKSLGDEGFLIRTSETGLLIAGGRQRGTMYGVYTFLETYLGCRWFSSTVSRIPRRSRIEIGAIDDRQVPALEYREAYSFDALKPEWAARNKCNGHFPPLDEKRGGHNGYVGPFVHSFYQLVPPEEYFDEHPEYYAEVDGVRLREHAQLCLSHPDVLDISLRRIREWVAANPDARIVSVSQNDSRNPCQCAACSAIDAEEGNYSGSLIRFVNRVAEALETDYPHLAIDTLAYQYTRKAPKLVRPRPNVIVRLCSIECCFSHPLEQCGEKMLLKQDPGTGATFVEDLADWGRICNRLYVWDYVTNFSNYLMPFPNLHVLQPNIRMFIRNNVKGLFEQGDNAPGGGGEFAELRHYVIAKLLWNPEADANLLIDEFLSGYYGRGGFHLRRFIDALAGKVMERDEDGVLCHHASIYDRVDNDYLTKDIIELADRCYDEAEALADDEATLQRLRASRLSIRYAKLAVAPLELPGRAERIDRFRDDVIACGITEISEGRQLAKPIEELRQGIHFSHFARYEGGSSPLEAENEYLQRQRQKAAEQQ